MKLRDLNILSFGEDIGLTGAVFSSTCNTGCLICMYPEQPEPSLENVELLNMDLEDWKTVLRQLDLQETEVKVKDPETGEIVKALLRKTQRVIENRVSWAVFKRDHYHCRYCGKDGVPLTVDHLICWEDGGPSIEDNLVAACRLCNKARGDTEYAAWLRSPYYQKVSRNLPMAVVEANEKLIPTLKLIPRRYAERATRK